MMTEHQHHHTEPERIRQWLRYVTTLRWVLREFGTKVLETYFRSYSKITYMSRKHLTQMTDLEKAFVHGFVRSNHSRVTGRRHFFDRATERFVTMAEAKETLKTGLVIEVNNDRADDIRALVRSKNGTCVVVSLVNLQVVTVYYNAPTDTHDTLNWNVYRWAANMVEVVKQCRAAVA